MSVSKCNHCGTRDNIKLCSGCKGIYYCSADHQKADWKQHKSTCTKITQAKKEGVVKETTTAGDASQVPKPGQEVTVSYVGKFANGSIFDQNETFSFTLGAQQVIKGWDVGIGKLSKGEKATLYISSDFAYGPRGASIIPPDFPLIFDVELKEFK